MSKENAGHPSVFLDNVNSRVTNSKLLIFIFVYVFGFYLLCHYYIIALLVQCLIIFVLFLNLFILTVPLHYFFAFLHLC